jgi:uncharacterized membrane protein YccC
VSSMLRGRDGDTAGPSALGSAVRAAARFDRSVISFSAGLLAAIPVVTVLGIGIALGDPVPGVTMGAGAMLVGIAWRVTGGRPPLAVMAVDAGVMALSTFVGSVTGSVLWVHVLVLCLWSLGGGLLVGVGNRGGVVGTQAIIAVVVFGRFSQPPAQALGLAGLVLIGGLAQVVFLSVIRWPLPLRAQRHGTADAYRKLAELAAAEGAASTLPVGTALDEAADSLASGALFGDATMMTLRSLVSEGQRLRVQLVALQALRSDEHAEPVLDRALELTASALQLAAEAIDGDEAAARRLPEITEQLSEIADRDTTPDAVSPFVARRLQSLAGQLRAIATLAPAAGRGGGLRSRRPYGRTGRPVQRIVADVAQLRANISLKSPIWRHALRLALVVPLATLLARELPLERSYWVAVAAATVLRPEFGATFTRGTERAIGTAAGVGLAGIIAVALHPAGGVTVVLVGVLAWLGYSLFPASFAVGFAFITALVVFLLNAVSPDTLSTASARLVDTLIGGALGLLVYALWPTWSHEPAWQSVADLVAAERVYADAVLSALRDGVQAREEDVRPLARRARLARTQAEAIVARSQSEPATRQIDARQSQAALGALRRLMQSAHVLRLEAQEDLPRRPHPEIGALQSALDEQLHQVEDHLRALPADGLPAGPLPDLRGCFRVAQRAWGDDPDTRALANELDEMVDAANGLAAVAGLRPDDSEPESAPAPAPAARPLRRRVERWLPGAS